MRNFIYILIFSLSLLISLSGEASLLNFEKKIFFSFLESSEFIDTFPTIDIVPKSIKDLNIPRSKFKDSIIRHYAYSLQYNIKDKYPIWVSYELSSAQLKGVVTRENNFESDPKIYINTNFDNDYKGSGFDRGHLVPAGDMKWSDTAMKESFYYSNITPQYPGFNRGIWKKLEDQVRSWTEYNDKIFITVGPYIDSSNQEFGKNNLKIPRSFFKVVLDYSIPEIKGIAFLIPNNSSNLSLDNFAMSIDSIEEITKIDFFPNLPDEQEKIIESTLCFNCWFNSYNQNSKSKNIIHRNNLLIPKEIHNSSSQCKGRTNKGIRCKNKTANSNGYCHLHQIQ